MNASRTMPARIVQAARGWIGTPYHDQASVKGVGCDCLGLIRGIWREVIGPEPMPVPPYSRDWGEAGPVEILAEAARAAMIELPIDEARTGDVVLFRMRPGAIAKHAGILSSRRDGGVRSDRSTRSDRSGRSRRSTRSYFIHAYERTGVIEEPLTEAWERRIAFAFRFPVPERGKG